MGTNDLFADTALPLSLDQRAMAILNDMGDVLPCDGGDSLDSFYDELIDEGAFLKDFIREVVSCKDDLSACDSLRLRARNFAYAVARKEAGF